MLSIAVPGIVRDLRNVSREIFTCARVKVAAKFAAFAIDAIHWVGSRPYLQGVLLFTRVGSALLEK